jgi:hypothetical protein
MDNDLERFLRLAGNAAQVLAPMLIPGGGLAATAIKAGIQNGPAIAEAAEGMITALKAAKRAHSGSVPAEAVKGEVGLMEKVRAHAERTFDRAERGDG